MTNNYNLLKLTGVIIIFTFLLFYTLQANFTSNSTSNNNQIEYKVVKMDDSDWNTPNGFERFLNKYGDEGWKFLSIWGGRTAYGNATWNSAVFCKNCD